ncbi:hypothetical protein RSOLAG22IIIB_07859 [Rhizoctonia solani]|uniref:Uncharacterized protein n=1 Tax=Rhizoctonia solani TaxID=456999 RepID=A0A0K6FQJ1_9AGAM|nr:hypothetical protein RSOLAG22IIIB_07859 [Rhizoctonia solani]
MNTQNNRQLLHDFADAFLANSPISSAGINEQLLDLGSRLDETNRLIAESIKSCDRQFGEVKSQLDDINRRVGDVEHQVADIKHQVDDIKHQVEHVKRQVNGVKRQVNDVKDRVKHVEHQVGYVNRQIANVDQKSDRQFQDLHARLEYYNRLADARSFNSSAHLDKGLLHPLPLPDGGLPPAGKFPLNARAFSLLATEPAELESLLRLYGLPVHESSLVNHKELAKFFCIRW